MIDLKKIMATTDFSSYSRHAFTYAETLAKEFRARLYIIHVVEDKLPTFVSEYTAVPLADIIESQEKKAWEDLKKFVESEVDKSIEVELIVARGTPYVEIIKAAREKEIDLIVVATYGRNILSHTLFGSTAERVVRKAPCPVLSVKHPEHEFIMP
ncbi:MAG: universal stress protein [Acidobacteriota bacterium]